MFRPVTGSAHGPNHPTARPVNHEAFSLAWAEPSVYATGASGRRGSKRLTNSSLFSTVCMSYVCVCMYVCIYIYIYIFTLACFADETPDRLKA